MSFRLNVIAEGEEQLKTFHRTLMNLMALNGFVMRDVSVRDLGITHYPEIFLKMRDYSRARDMNSNDEIWILSTMRSLL